MNKKRIFGMIGTAALVVVIALNINANFHNDALPDLALANIQALAKNENGNVSNCYNTLIWDPWFMGPPFWPVLCQTCYALEVHSAYDSSTCPKK